MLFHGRDVFRMVTQREQSAVNLRVQRLHAAVHHFGKPGNVRDVEHRDAASRSVFAVPPVLMISTPKLFSSCAKSTIPVLSETLINARRILRSPASLFSVMWFVCEREGVSSLNR